jgi:hypothetical protein
MENEYENYISVYCDNAHIADNYNDIKKNTPYAVCFDDAQTDGKKVSVRIKSCAYSVTLINWSKLRVPVTNFGGNRIHYILTTKPLDLTCFVAKKGWSPSTMECQYFEFTAVKGLVVLFCENVYKHKDRPKHMVPPTYCQMLTACPNVVRVQSEDDTFTHIYSISLDGECEPLELSNKTPRYRIRVLK